ncbi:MAG: hypothetical protein P4L45_15400 [Ignavibacteriaceae bacterium]|nr:hypothetical protein [Ignavibacteriaceae bacterium]
MTPLESEIERKFRDLKVYLDAGNRTIIKSKAHGGNSILFIYLPENEPIYLKELSTRYNPSAFVNIADTLVEYIEKVGLDEFIEYYKDHAYDPGEVFVSDSDYEGDFFHFLLNKIQTVSLNNDIVFIVRTGALLGTNISNAKLLENEIISNLKNPLVIMYPARIDPDIYGQEVIKFLGFQNASNYRSFIIK